MYVSAPIPFRAYPHHRMPCRRTAARTRHARLQPRSQKSPGVGRRLRRHALSPSHRLDGLVHEDSATCTSRPHCPYRSIFIGASALPGHTSPTPHHTHTHTLAPANVTHATPLPTLRYSDALITSELQLHLHPGCRRAAWLLPGSEGELCKSQACAAHRAGMEDDYLEYEERRAMDRRPVDSNPLYSYSVHMTGILALDFFLPFLIVYIFGLFLDVVLFLDSFCAVILLFDSSLPCPRATSQCILFETRQ